jgi:hypothetical protein
MGAKVEFVYNVLNVVRNYRVPIIPKKKKINSPPSIKPQLHVVYISIQLVISMGGGGIRSVDVNFQFQRSKWWF